MKKIIIKNAAEFSDLKRKQYPFMGPEVTIFGPEEGADKMVASDGYHTFEELYDHRYELFIALCSTILTIDGNPTDPILPIWRSKLHANGKGYDGYFVLGINKEVGKQITYHLPDALWDRTDFAETLERAPEFDGHTPADVLERLKTL